MIKIYFECKLCGCTDGRIFSWDRDVVVECCRCDSIETLKDFYPEPNTVKGN